MSRPQIIRADTLDLQDKTSPTAQDHTRQPTHPNPLGIGPAAPHQAAALHHVQEERASEEMQLREAWNYAARAEPPSDDNDEDEEEEEQDHQHQNGMNGDARYHDQDSQRNGNGQYGGQAEDHEMAEGESDEEDMMDKISSSPSIDDGGYSSRSAPAPGVSTPQNDRQRPSTAPSPAPSVGSSPFVNSPQHLPLRVADGASAAQHNPDSPCSSPFVTTPVHFPILKTSASGDTVSKDHHHDEGEYAEVKTDDHLAPTAAAAATTTHSQHDGAISNTVTTGDHDITLTSQPLERDMSISSLNEEAMGRLLLPADDPLLGQEIEFGEQLGTRDARNRLTATSTEEDGWETDTNTSSFNSDDYNDDDPVDFSPYSHAKHSRFVDSGWGGECLQETEDIDFEFVYALHTFVATVEGQANATKGDTMVLLDDSNSYWWLVRIVKDSSIGYLPAEHIETPTERLARLNKHRNVDLSATMLGDTAEKSKNPLKKAMRRRNTRAVRFGDSPEYFEASDYDFSSDEEDGDDSMLENANQGAQSQRSAYDISVGHSDEIEPVATNARPAQESADNEVQLNGRADEVDSRSRGDEQPRQSEESIIDKQFGPGRSRNGTVRNTDSFFGDGGVETRKITLTPNILRDESLGAATNVRPSDTRERGASFDSIGRSESGKEDKKRKEKKSGMFSGLFKKKDKKGRGSEDFDDKQTEELSPKFPEDNSPLSPTSGSFSSGTQPLGRTGSRGKLQKMAAKGDGSPNLSQPGAAEQLSPQKQPSPQLDQPAASAAPATSITQQASMRMVQPSDEEPRNDQPPSLRIKTEQPETEQQSNRTSGSLMSSFIDTLRSPDDGQPKREKVRQAKQRMELDDFDSSPEEGNGDPFADASEYTSGGYHQQSAAPPATERLSESPVQVSPIGQTQSLDTEDSGPAPGLVGDTSSQEDHDSSPASSPEFEDVGSEFKKYDTPMQSEARSFSPAHSAAPAPLSIRKQPSVRSMDQGHYVPPPPTRAAPTPGMDRATSPAVRQVSGTRSVTPTSALGKPPSMSAMNPFTQQPYSQQPHASSPTSTTDSTATPTPASAAAATAPAQPKTPPPQQSRPEPQWSDASLRAYMDDPSHFRNLLLVVRDTSDFVPLAPEDPKVQAWYPDERKQLQSLERDLDNLLQGWVNKKRKVKSLRT